MLKLKMFVQSVKKSEPGHEPMEQINMFAVGDGAPENKAWSKWTPSGQLQFAVTNPDAFGKVAAGDVVYVTLEKFAPVATVTSDGMAGL